MKRPVFAMTAPPVAVCRYGCAGFCAAPIAVFWITGIVGIVYGMLGGPLNLEGVSWGTLGLGAALWAIAAVWAYMTVRGVEADESDRGCERNVSTMCRLVRPQAVDGDPFDQVSKYHRP